jgi:hypothetical protein
LVQPQFFLLLGGVQIAEDDVVKVNAVIVVLFQEEAIWISGLALESLEPYTGASHSANRKSFGCPP